MRMPGGGDEDEGVAGTGIGVVEVTVGGGTGVVDVARPAADGTAGGIMVVSISTSGSPIASSLSARLGWSSGSFCAP